MIKMVKCKNNLVVFSFLLATFCFIVFAKSSDALEEKIIEPTQLPKEHGYLLVKPLFEGCNDDVAIERKNNKEGNTSTTLGEKIKLVPGSYKITVNILREKIIKDNVLINSGETTILKISELGGFVMKNSENSFIPPFRVFFDNSELDKTFFPGDTYCFVSLGKYQIKYTGGVRHKTTRLEYGYYCDIFSNYLITSASTRKKLEHDFKVEPGQVTIIDPDKTNLQFGQIKVLHYDSKNINLGGVSLEFEEMTSNEKFEHYGSLGSKYEIVPGKYKVRIHEQPYTGTIYDLEIKPGEVVTLKLPKIDEPSE